MHEAIVDDAFVPQRLNLVLAPGAFLVDLGLLCADEGFLVDVGVHFNVGVVAELNGVLEAKVLVHGFKMSGEKATVE